MATEQQILAALSEIRDPDLGQNIVELHFIKDLRIDGAGSDISFAIELTTPACPVKDAFKAQAEKLVLALPGVKNVRVTMTAKPSRNEGMIKDSGLGSVNSVIAVSSCKGGVGKSTVAAFLAKELAQRGMRVGLLDADIFGPSVPTLFDVHHPELVDAPGNKLFPVEKNGIKLMSFGFLAGNAPAVLRGPMVSSYMQQLLHNVAWGNLDYLILDMPPGTGDIQLTITQSVELDGAIIVTTNQALSLPDVERGILMFEHVNVPILGVVENMSYFACDDCSKKHYIFGGSTADQLRQKFGIATLGELPIMAKLVQRVPDRLEFSAFSQLTDTVIRELGKRLALEQKKPEINADASAISIAWPDGTTSTVGNFDLRLRCRCAVCVDEFSGEQKLHPEHIRPDIAALEVKPLGNYAISVKWNDGHATGIYPWLRIKELAARAGH